MKPHGLTLIHYSRNPLRLSDLYTTPQNQNNFKPYGLWVSVQDFGQTWAEWCTSENYGLANLRYPHRITLTDDADVLWLRGEKAIDDFTTRYATKENMSVYLKGINWNKVRKQHQGIIIAPYVWDRRLTSHTMWYHGWDCASGCIWDMRAIQSVDAEVSRPALGTGPRDTVAFEESADVLDGDREGQRLIHAGAPDINAD